MGNAKGDVTLLKCRWESAEHMVTPLIFVKLLHLRSPMLYDQQVEKYRRRAGSRQVIKLPKVVDGRRNCKTQKWDVQSP